MCEACDIAATHPKTGHYGAGCIDCQARAIAASNAAWKAAHAITNVDLQADIERVFGIDGYAEGRRLVWAWMQRLGVVEPRP